MPGQRGLGLQVLEIAQRVEQTVGVVDADSRHQRFLYQVERDAVHDAEYFRALHPDCGQVVDVEKSAIVDFVGGNAPKTQAIGLVIQDFLQSVEAVRVSFAAIDDGQYFLQTSAHGITVLDQGGQTAADDLFLALSFPDFGQVSVLTQREMRDSGENALQFLDMTVRVGEFFFRLDQNAFQQGGPRTRSQRKVDAQRIENKPAAVKQDANGLTFEDQAKLVGQKGQQDFIGQLGFGRVPVNIEMAGIV